MLKLLLAQRRFQLAMLFAVGAIAFLNSATPALAHHAMGGKTPTNFFEGFLSGLAHPIIGIDHFAFVVASGLIAAGVTRGMTIPIFFILATVIGTTLHLQEFNLPFLEIVIALSVMLFGVLLAIANTKVNLPKFFTITLAALAGMAGIFHGYAYGEAIIGAQMNPLIAYLSGFALIQLIIATIALLIGKVILENSAIASLIMRSLGLTIGTIGVVFLTASI